MKDSCFQMKLPYVQLREDGFMGLQSHPEEEAGLQGKPHIAHGLFPWFAMSCCYLRDIFGTRLFKHAVDMNVSSNQSIILMKSGI